MTPEEFAARIRATRGITLTGTPVTPIPDPATIRSLDAPTPVPTVPIATTPPPARTDIVTAPGGPATDPGAPPTRMPSKAAVDAWRSGAQPITPPAAVTAPSPAVAGAAPPPVSRPFPVEGTDPVPNAPPGISLTSTPAATPAPGWAGTVGMQSPEASQAYDAGKSYEKLMSGLDDVAKGLHPKAPAANPFPTMAVEQPNQPNAMAGQLMAALMQNKRPRGLTLTGQ